MFGHTVREEHVNGASGRMYTHSAMGPSPGGGRFGPPIPTWSVVRKDAGQVGQPVGVGPGVVVDVGHDFTFGRTHPRVPGAAQSPVFGRDDLEAVFLGDGPRSRPWTRPLTTITSKFGYSSFFSPERQSRMVRLPL